MHFKLVLIYNKKSHWLQNAASKKLVKQKNGLK